MKIKQRRQRHTSTEYLLHFEWIQCGGGFQFKCAPDGTVDILTLTPAGRKNYLDCVSGALKVRKGQVEKSEHSWIEPAIGICDCGEEVFLDGFTNTCHRCWADYNSAGEKLADRSQWGEETGESVADILSVDSYPSDPYDGHTPLEDFDF